MTQKSDKIQVWPEMILRETLAALLATILLVLVSMYLNAPLESLADPSTSTNPSKAPWYFLGLQELLVYFSPWIAGVLIPTCILLGLAAIPYIDVSEARAGADRGHPFARLLKGVFSGGLLLWILLTLIGVYLRGPNWRLQWPDGTPLGADTATGPSGWLIPTIIAGYGLLILARLRKHSVSIRQTGLMRWLAVHIMTLAGLIVLLTIVLHMGLRF